MAGEKVFMWKAESGGSLVYLLGSIHMADESFYPLDPAIESAFDESSKLVVEVDITNQDQAALQSLVAARGLYQGDDSLDQHISAETMQAVASYLGEMEIIMQILVKLKPWAVYLTLEQLEMEKMGLNAEYGIDLHFLNKAKKDSKPVAQLESMEAQLNLISGFPDKTQEGMIMMTITEAEKRAESLGSVISAW
ncbi:MAG: TraB/GumN family protein, partial [Nitrospinota bacterium]|nr:TraB/GumN family protein [Nitrospinota bacterium]